MASRGPRSKGKVLGTDVRTNVDNVTKDLKCGNLTAPKLKSRCTTNITQPAEATETKTALQDRTNIIAITTSEPLDVNLDSPKSAVDIKHCKNKRKFEGAEIKLKHLPTIAEARNPEPSFFAPKISLDDGTAVHQYMAKLAKTAEAVLPDESVPEKVRGRPKRDVPLINKLHDSWGGRTYHQQLMLAASPLQEETTEEKPYTFAPPVDTSDVLVAGSSIAVETDDAVQTDNDSRPGQVVEAETSASMPRKPTSVAASPAVLSRSLRGNANHGYKARQGQKDNATTTKAGSRYIRGRNEQLASSVHTPFQNNNSMVSKQLGTVAEENLPSSQKAPELPVQKLASPSSQGCPKPNTGASLSSARPGRGSSKLPLAPREKLDKSSMVPRSAIKPETKPQRQKPGTKVGVSSESTLDLAKQLSMEGELQRVISELKASREETEKLSEENRKLQAENDELRGCKEELKSLKALTSDMERPKWDKYKTELKQRILNDLEISFDDLDYLLK